MFWALMAKMQVAYPESSCEASYPCGISFGAGTSSPVPVGAPRKLILCVSSRHGSRAADYSIAASDAALSVALFHVWGTPLVLPMHSTASSFGPLMEVDDSDQFDTKGMRHYNIQENCICEAIHEFHEVRVDHVAGVMKPANSFTKEFRSDEVFCSLCNLFLSPHHLDGSVWASPRC